ncbi:MAG: Ldh family oxidoreductase [Kiritimatiellae bacterium]|nr:Ldh family oxidoreductase [Kiritimatiellia bacterium]
MKHIPAERLRELSIARLRHEGLAEEQAQVVVDHMITADLWGKRTHGIGIRLPGVVSQARQGVKANRPAIEKDTGAAVLVNGNDAFGSVGGVFCTDLVIERVARHGLAMVGLKNSRHTGMLGYFVDKAARAGVVAMAVSHCRPIMAPFGGKRALLGTNPIAFAFPRAPDPIVVDMATSEISYGKLREALAHGEPLPPDAALDKAGNPTQDPAEAKGGALLPFGRHRGSALAVAIQLLAGVCTGAAPIPDAGTHYGFLIVGFDKSLFVAADGYEGALQAFVDAYLAVPPREGYELRLPGTRRPAPGGEDVLIAVEDDAAALLEPDV